MCIRDSQYTIPAANLSEIVKLSFDFKPGKTPSSNSLLLELKNPAGQQTGAVYTCSDLKMGLHNYGLGYFERITDNTLTVGEVNKVTVILDMIAGKYTLYIGDKPLDLTWFDLNPAQSDKTLGRLTFWDRMYLNPYYIDNLKLEKEFASYNSVNLLNENFDGVTTAEAELNWRVNSASDMAISMENNMLNVAVDYDTHKGGNQFAEATRIFAPVSSDALITETLVSANVPSGGSIITTLKNQSGEVIGEIGYFNATTLYIKKHRRVNRKNNRACRHIFRRV